MALPFEIRDMIGLELADAVDAAQLRLADDTVTARCHEGRWLIERGGVEVATDLAYAEAVTAAAELA